MLLMQLEKEETILDSDTRILYRNIQKNRK
jgi:hypothetical protein